MVKLNKPISNTIKAIPIWYSGSLNSWINIHIYYMNMGYLTLKICLHRSYSVLRKKECGHQFFKQYQFLI